MSEKKELTRAEEVRQRREQESSQRSRRAARKATRQMPPVTTRDKPTSTTPRSRRAQNARRRFQVALPIPSDDVRTLSIPRPRVGSRAFSFILVAILATALYFVYSLPYFRVAQAQITGNQMLSAQEVTSAMGIANRPIFTLKPAELETRLRLNFPELVSANVNVALPNVVSVNLVERHPVIRWEQGGSYTWVAEDGVAFRPRGEMAELISVVAEGAPSLSLSASDPLNPTPFISTEMVRALKGLGAHVPPGMVIIYNPDYGFGWNDPRGWRVYFGTSADDVELKMRVYEAMVNSLTQRGIRPAMINVTYPTAPYYRLTQ